MKNLFILLLALSISQVTYAQISSSKTKTKTAKKPFSKVDKARDIQILAKINQLDEAEKDIPFTNEANGNRSNTDNCCKRAMNPDGRNNYISIKNTTQWYTYDERKKDNIEIQSPLSSLGKTGERVKAQLRTSTGKFIKYKLVEIVDNGEAIFTTKDIKAGNYYLLIEQHGKEYKVGFSITGETKPKWNKASERRSRKN